MILLQSCFSWSWTKQLSVADGKENNLIIAGVKKLENYSEKNDCFKSAARHISSKCMRETSYHEKLSFAIELTICEIQSASLQVPMECLSDRQDACINALSRSPQLWTSYSGFVKETVLMCYSTRAGIEKDELISSYRNHTALQHEHYNELNNHLAMLRQANELSQTFRDTFRLDNDHMHKITSEIIENLNEIHQKQEEAHIALSDSIQYCEQRLEQSFISNRHFSEQLTDTLSLATSSASSMSHYLTTSIQNMSQELEAISRIMAEQQDQLQLFDKTLDQSERKTATQNELIEAGTQLMFQNLKTTKMLKESLESSYFMQIGLGQIVSMNIDSIEKAFSSQRHNIDLLNNQILFLGQNVSTLHEYVVNSKGIIEPYLSLYSRVFNATPFRLFFAIIILLSFLSPRFLFIMAFSVIIVYELDSIHTRLGLVVVLFLGVLFWWWRYPARQARIGLVKSPTVIKRELYHSKYRKMRSKNNE